MPSIVVPWIASSKTPRFPWRSSPCPPVPPHLESAWLLETSHGWSARSLAVLLVAVPTAILCVTLWTEMWKIMIPPDGSFYLANFPPRLIALGKKFLIANRDNLTRMTTAFVSILVAVKLLICLGEQSHDFVGKIGALGCTTEFVCEI